MTMRFNHRKNTGGPQNSCEEGKHRNCKALRSERRHIKRSPDIHWARWRKEGKHDVQKEHPRNTLKHQPSARVWKHLRLEHSAFFWYCLQTEKVHAVILWNFKSNKLLSKITLYFKQYKNSYLQFPIRLISSSLTYEEEMGGLKIS